MKRWTNVLAVVVVSAPLLLGGCDAEAAESVPAEEVPVVLDGGGLIVAEGVVEPVRWAELCAPPDGGKVMLVSVEEGDRVSEGDQLVDMNTSDAALAVRQAEAALSGAQAELARVKAAARPEEIAVDEARLAVARAAVAAAEARQARLRGGESTAEIAEAQAAVAAAQAEEKQAFYLHERTMECLTFEWKDEKHEICPALGRPEEGARHAWYASQDSLAAAEAQLRAAQNRAWSNGRDAEAGVAAAAAQERALQAELDLRRAGSVPESLASAQLDVRRAEAALEAARAALRDLSIRAPFDATVAQVTIRTGEVAAPGQVLVVLATLDDLHVRTKDLIELDVVKVSVGDHVTVTLDAVPDAPLDGQVTRIDEQSEDYRGDVTYPVRVGLLEDVQALRWGMTAMVAIDGG